MGQGRGGLSFPALICGLFELQQPWALEKMKHKFDSFKIISWMGKRERTTYSSSITAFRHTYCVYYPCIGTKLDVNKVPIHKIFY